MAGRPKMSAAQRSLMLQQQSASVLSQANALLVKEAMRVHGEIAVNLCHGALIAQGLITDQNIVVPNTHLVVAARAPAPPPSEVIWNDGMGKSWSDCTVKFIRLFLEAVDPVGMSEATLRKLGKRHAKEPNKLHVLQFFEMVFGLDASALVGEWTSWNSLVAFGRQRWEQYGQRSRHVVIPVEYGENGIYNFREADKNFFLTN